MTGPLQQGPLREDWFNALLHGRLATRVAYLRAYLCPNGNTERGGHDSQCPVCKGDGYFWEEVVPEAERTKELTRAPHPSRADREKLPVVRATLTRIVDEAGAEYPPESVTVLPDGTVRWVADARPADGQLYFVTYRTTELRAGVQGLTTRREFQARGEFDVSDLELTLDAKLEDGETDNPAWNVGERDRFLLVDAWRRHSQLLQRGVKDRAIYRRTRAERVTSVENGAIKVWVPGVDFSIVEGEVRWEDGRGPARGKSYAFEAEVNPDYFVFLDLPQLRQQDGKKLPRRVGARLFEQFANFRKAKAF